MSLVHTRCEFLETIAGEVVAAAKPMTRWWWFGGAVTPQEISPAS